jgi:hypothetical protein
MSTDREGKSTPERIAFPRLVSLENRRYDLIVFIFSEWMSRSWNDFLILVSNTNQQRQSVLSSTINWRLHCPLLLLLYLMSHTALYLFLCMRVSE